MALKFSLPAYSRTVWSIALPAMLTNLATALFGIADMWAIGRLGDANAQGGVELGAKAMLAMLNLFNFLRTGTVALTARAAGADDAPAQARALLRALALALIIGIGLLAAMKLIVPLAIDLLGAGTGLRTSAQTYLSIRFWSAPIWLVDCALAGWLIGQRRVRAVLAIEVSANVAHIVLDLLLVLVWHRGVAGVALATVCSEALKCAVLAWACTRAPATAVHMRAMIRDAATWRGKALTALLALNRDLFLRTLLLNAVILVFTRIGARHGAEALAANGILFQLFMLVSLILDGFESAAQVLCGEAVGQRSRSAFTAALATATGWAALVAIGLSAVYACGGAGLIAAFSTNAQVVARAQALSPWLMALPLAGFASFVLDGAFVGAGWTRAMLGTMAMAMAVFAALAMLFHAGGNAALWFAFTAFLAMRAVGQTALLPRLLAATFPATKR